MATGTERYEMWIGAVVLVVAGAVVLAYSMYASTAFAGTGDPGVGPTIVAPTEVCEGRNLEGVASDVDDPVLIELKDGNGNVIGTDDDPGENNSFSIPVPIGVAGPLLLVATDALGNESSQSVTAEDCGILGE